MLVSARVPLAGFAAVGRPQTTLRLLFSRPRLEQSARRRRLASLVLAARRRAPLARLSSASSAFARSRDAAGARPRPRVCAASTRAHLLQPRERRLAPGAHVLGPQPSFVDASGFGDAAMLQSPSSERGFATEYLFWNRSLDSLCLLPGAPTDRLVRGHAPDDRPRRHPPRRRPTARPGHCWSTASATRLASATPTRSAVRARLPLASRPGRHASRSTLPAATTTAGSDSRRASSSGREIGGRLAGRLTFELTVPEGAPRCKSISAAGPPRARGVVQPGATQHRCRFARVLRGDGARGSMAASSRPLDRLPIGGRYRQRARRSGAAYVPARTRQPAP